MILDNLLGPNDIDPDCTRLCDIIFPEGDITTFGLAVIGSDDPRSLLSENRDILDSVGVGGVFTIMGAPSVCGGVCGVADVSIGFTLLAEAVRGRPSDEVG